MNKKTERERIFHQTKPWVNNENSIWLASTLSLSRNIEKFHFPSKLDLERKKQLIALIGKELTSQKFLKKPILIRSEDIEPHEKEFLMEHFLTIRSFQQAHSGEAFILEKSGEFLGIINLQDHLQLFLIDCKGEIENTWNQLVSMESRLGKSITYAFSPKFGFLTSDCSDSGIGLRITAFLQPSALIHSGRMQEVLDQLNSEMITLAGLQGSPTDIIGDIIAVKNTFSLGVTEENVLSTIRLFVTKFLVEENTERDRIRKNQNPEVMDRVSRAFGILIHSYQIDVIEALNAISLIKLGCDLGWVKGITPMALNELFFNCRRAHLLNVLKKADVSSEDLLHLRAEYIHKTLKKVKLTV